MKKVKLEQGKPLFTPFIDMPPFNYLQELHSAVMMCSNLKNILRSIAMYENSCDRKMRAGEFEAMADSVHVFSQRLQNLHNDIFERGEE